METGTAAGRLPLARTPRPRPGKTRWSRLSRSAASAWAIGTSSSSASHSATGRLSTRPLISWSRLMSSPRFSISRYARGRPLADIETRVLPWPARPWSASMPRARSTFLTATSTGKTSFTRESTPGASGKRGSFKAPVLRFDLPHRPSSFAIAPAGDDRADELVRRKFGR